MALITVSAVVDVPTNALVVGIGLALGVTVRAREHQVVGWIGVAGGAHAIGSAVIGRKPGVVEHGAEPGTGVVASLARGRKAGSDMARVVRSLIIRLMATVASCWKCGVVVVHVTLRAGDGHVKAREWESGQIVIEGGLQPRRGVVTHLTSIGEPNRRMRGIVGAVVIRHVASRTGRISQVVVSVHVALGARHIHMEARQREPCVVVIESRRQPGNC